MYKIDRRGVQKSFSRTDPLDIALDANILALYDPSDVNRII